MLHGKLHSQVYNEFLEVNIVREKIVNDLIFTNNQVNQCEMKNIK